MISIKGNVFTRCDRCGRSGILTIDESIDWGYHEEHSMGPELFYETRNDTWCECGNCISVKVVASEYPIGDLIIRDVSLTGAESTKLPDIEIEELYDPELSISQRKQIYTDPENIIQNMTDREFEIFVGGVFRYLGYEEVIVTQKSRDGGFDFEAWRVENGIRTLLVGECKHFSSHRKVNEDIIRKIHDVQMQRNANQSIVVTTSAFTRVAMERAAEYNIALWGTDELLEYGGHLL